MNAPAHSLRYRDGDVIAGKYRLTQLLGEGGMGEVWEGVNIVLDSQVAIKLMKSDLTDDVLKQRLLREARTAAGLAHPAIIRVFDVGETPDGKPYVVMERLHGGSLREVIDEPGSGDVVEVVQALLPILDALSLAHDRGLVHRDVKPDNIFLSETGPDRLQPKLLDFGVVKAQAYKRFLTHTGTVVGSPPYMSPEQARGDEDIDSLADLWGISVILYEVATGRMPFEAPNYNALLRRIVEDDVPPVRTDNPVVASLVPIIERGLSKDRENRWQSAEELGRALASWLLKLGIGEDLTGQRLTGRWTAAGRRSIADRRRASLVDLQVVDFLPEPASDPGPEPKPRPAVPSDAATLSRAKGPAASRSWLFVAGVGIAVGALAATLWLAENDETAPANVAPQHAAANPAKGASSPRPAQADGPTVPAAQAKEAETPPAVTAPARVAKAPSRPRPKAPASRPPGVPRTAPKKVSTPELGLKDPY
jgi:eukaryotic-like serine/threonine-protein kinase